MRRRASGKQAKEPSWSMDFEIRPDQRRGKRRIAELWLEPKGLADRFVCRRRTNSLKIRKRQVQSMLRR